MINRSPFSIFCGNSEYHGCKLLNKAHSDELDLAGDSVITTSVLCQISWFNHFIATRRTQSFPAGSTLTFILKVIVQNVAIYRYFCNDRDGDVLPLLDG